MPLATVHSSFSQSCAKHLGIGGRAVSAVESASRSRLCDHADAERGGDNLATYVSSNLMWRIVESYRDDSGTVLIELRRDDSGLGNVEAECLKLVCSLEWIRARDHKFGRAGVVRDFDLLLDACSQNATEFYARVDVDATKLRAARRGSSSALRNISKVLQLFGIEHFNQGMMADSGLAGELYGRLAVLEFKRVDGAARRSARRLWPYCRRAFARARGRRGCARAAIVTDL